MNRKNILARLAQIKTEAKAIVDAADQASAGKLTKEQATQFDGLMTERAECEANIVRLDKLDEMSASVRSTTPAQPANPETLTIRGGAPVIESDPMRGFRSAAEFGRVVMKACGNGGFSDKRLAALQNEGSSLDVLGAPSNYSRETGSADGYMVPPQVAKEVEAMVLDSEGLLARINPEPTQSNVVEVLADESTPWGSSGVQAYWVEEGAQITGSRLATVAGTMSLHKLAALVLATDELIEDAPRLQSRLTTGAASAIAYKADEALVNGNGVGKPMGWFNAASLVSVAKETSQTADTVVAANVLKMRARLLGNGAGAFWVVHSTVIPQLGAMTLGQMPVWLAPSGSLKDAPGGTLLGLPVVVSEHCQIVGDKGDIQLIQPKGYRAAIKTAGLNFSTSMHLYFDYGIGAFRWTFRLGGQPKLSAAVTQAKGSGTLSHIITLDARA